MPRGFAGSIFDAFDTIPDPEHFAEPHPDPIPKHGDRHPGHAGFVSVQVSFQCPHAGSLAGDRHVSPPAFTSLPMPEPSR